MHYQEVSSTEMAIKSPGSDISNYGSEKINGYVCFITRTSSECKDPRSVDEVVWWV